MIALPTGSSRPSGYCEKRIANNRAPGCKFDGSYIMLSKSGQDGSAANDRFGRKQRGTPEKFFDYTTEGIRQGRVCRVAGMWRFSLNRWRDILFAYLP
jgi:hypothetical protein